jgi:hypothetical protein
MPFSAFETEDHIDKKESIHFYFSFWCGAQQFWIRVYGMMKVKWQFGVGHLQSPIWRHHLQLSIERPFLVGQNAFFPLLDLTSDFISIKQFSFSFLAI